MNRSSVIWTGYTILNVYVGFVLATFVFSNWFRRILGGDIGFPLLMFAFCLIPATHGLFWFLFRGNRRDSSWLKSRYLSLSRGLHVLAWWCSIFPVVFWVNFHQPWPLTLRNGPDTSYARKGFKEHVGFSPPPAVSNLYYRDDSFLFRHYYFRCMCSDSSVVSQMVVNLELKPVNKPGQVWGSKPSWWKDKLNRTNLVWYANGGNWRGEHRLLHDPESGTVWFSVDD